MLLLPLLALPALVLSHGIAHQPPDPNLPWAHRHLQSEHHITNYDHGAFFSLHDTDSDGHLSAAEVLRMYGLTSQSPDAARVLESIMKTIDHNGDNEISKDEWMKWGGQLPDFGTGIGHHGDDEYEYEIHHFEEFHGDEEEGEGVIHPEDVAHFKKHEEMEKAEERERMLEKDAVNVNNIPRKFRVGIK